MLAGQTILLILLQEKGAGWMTFELPLTSQLFF